MSSDREKEPRGAPYNGRQCQAPLARVRPDQKVVLMDDWETPEQRLKGAAEVLRSLVAIAEKGRKAA
jgi:transcription-repair coupling factor (superfamily II helicase)